MTLAVDMSHWGGTLTDDEAACLARYGYRRVIVNTSGGLTVQQAETARRHGLDVQAYVYLYWLGDIRHQVLRAVQTARDVADFLWLDAEEDPGGMTPANVVFLLRDAVAACTMPCGIYTRRSWWRAHTGDSREFSRLPLWDAYYDGVPSFVYWTPYGGWARPAMKQYGGTQLVCGQSVDVNYYEEVDVPTQQEWDQHIGEFRALFGHVVKMGETLNAVAGAFFRHVQEHGDGDADDARQAVEALDARLKAAAAALEGDG